MRMIKFFTFIISIGIFFNGCGIKYIPYKNTLIKKVKWDTVEEYRAYKTKHKNLELDGYSVDFYKVKSYLTYSHNYIRKELSLQDEESFKEAYGLIPYSKYTISYTFLMFTINQELFNKKLKPYFNTINQTYDNRLNQKTINKFVKYKCDKNIIFDEWERDENYKPLKATCYAKRLDKDVFLITRFAHPNTEDDTILFKNEIIPTMLKNIKVTPTKLSPWKYY